MPCATSRSVKRGSGALAGAPLAGRGRTCRAGGSGTPGSAAPGSADSPGSADGPGSDDTPDDAAGGSSAARGAGSSSSSGRTSAASARCLSHRLAESATSISRGSQNP
jgi:hypothetical protein